MTGASKLSAMQYERQPCMCQVVFMHNSIILINYESYCRGIDGFSIKRSVVVFLPIFHAIAIMNYFFLSSLLNMAIFLAD